MKKVLISLALMAAIIAVSMSTTITVAGWDPIEMPEPHVPPALTEDTPTEPSSKDNSFIPFLIGLMAILNVIVILVLILDKKKNASNANNASQPAKSTYCTECGSALPYDAKFCWSCGGEAKKP